MFCFCAHSRRLARLLTARYDAALAPVGLTSSQFEILSVVEVLGPCSGRILASKLALDKTTLSRNVKPLVTAGLIAAQTSTEDARTMLYSIAPAGRRKLARAMPLWHAVHTATEIALGAHAENAQSTLQHMIHTVQ